jgi:purine-nucleoside phosphorylase
MDERLEKGLKAIRSRTDFKPTVALVLGSGLGDYAETIEVADSVDYGDIPGFPVSTVAGHRGRFIFGYVGKVPAVIMQGRVHFYEGYPVGDVVLPTRLMGLLGAEVLFLTNACGAINTAFAPGDFMLNRDHILMGVPSPLRGRISTRGPPLSRYECVYDAALRLKIRIAGESLGIILQEGVYIQAPDRSMRRRRRFAPYGILVPTWSA